MYKELDEVWAEFTGEGNMFTTTQVGVRGVQLNSFAMAPNSLRDIWLMAAGYAERDYLIYEDEKWTYAEAMAESASIANWMYANGIKQGDRVALAMRNYPEWMLSYWALTSVGITVVGMNAWWVGDEMRYGLSDAAPKAIICDTERLQTLVPIKNEFPDMKIIGVRLDAAVDGVIDYAELRNQGGTMPDVTIDGDEDACIFYTSGTTGRPKGAQLTQRGCVLNIMNIAFMNLCQTTALARANGTEAELPAPDQQPQLITLVTTPLFHVTANNCVAQPATLSGGTIVHMYKWDAGTALKLIEQHKITGISGVPVMSREIISHPDFAKYDTSSITALGGGGAQLQPDLVGKINDALENGKAATGYGMTETCGIITAISNAYFADKPDSAGRIVPTLEAKCIDADGNDLPMGEVGELCVKGGNVIKGYLNREEATAESIIDGWFRTGDIARFDEQGFVYIVDRAKDMVLRGGENIYCAEVESALFKHDAVAECVVFGVDDERLGEEVGAAIVIAEGVELTVDELREHCAGLLAKFKIPRYIWLRRDLLPRNASGKFLKRELRDSLDTADAA
ncbi:MAG: class I adenylate-forming enzyme family protein [Parvibaculales bacterium]